MGFRALVETNTGERYRLRHANGLLGGKALLSFLTALESMRVGNSNDQDMFQWFVELEKQLRQPVPDIVQLLLRCYYSGDWAYTEEEYDVFCLRSPALLVDEQTFTQTIQEIAQKWVDIIQLHSHVEALLHTLEQRSLPATWWYDPEWTLCDFRALQETLSLAMTRNAEHVRIQFI